MPCAGHRGSIEPDSSVTMNVRPGAAGSEGGNLMTSDLPFGIQSTSQMGHSGTGGPPVVGNAIVTW